MKGRLSRSKTAPFFSTTAAGQPQQPRHAKSFHRTALAAGLATATTATATTATATSAGSAME